MSRKLFTLLLCLGAMITMDLDSNAQSRLIHYWNFNTFSSTINLPAVANLAADYSIIDTAKARLTYAPAPPGVSGAYLSFSDGAAAGSKDFDTVNAQLGAPAGNYFRARNPADSMQLLIYIPSTHYQNITLRYATETSSITSGDSAQVYSYSVDSGVTWSTAGLSIPSITLNTATWDTFRAASVSILDPLANNNPKLVFRIIFKGRTTGTSGNNRFDNISVKGDTIPVSGTLIHFWDFNTFTGVYHNPNFFPVTADYSIHDTANVKILFGTAPGTSSSNPTYFDFGSASGSDADTVNSNWSSVPALGVVSPGNWVRMRNPDDSSYLYIYMPTNNYKNILLKYATQTSSNASGDSIQVYNYSVDSGLTWRLSGISEALDSAWLAGMPTDPASIPFRPTPVSIQFTDPAAYNNPKLVFRIHLVGKNTGLSGNNRFDNFSVQGDSIVSALSTITTTHATYGPLCNTTANPVSVAYTTTGTLGTTYEVQITNQNGTFPTNTTSNIIGTGISSPISAIIPSGTLPGINYRVRVVNSNPGIYGSDNGSDIILAGVAGPIAGATAACIGATSALSESGIGTWTSSATSVATIDSIGLVTGIAKGTSSITYSVGAGCTASTTVTVNSLPAIISGTPNACISSATTLSDSTALGAWSSSATGVATVGSGSGIVTGITTGTATISYTVSSTGCFKTQNVLVNPLPSAITGTTVLCATATTTLSDPAAGGAWSSSSTSIATVGTGTGIVSGVSGGTPIITYKLPTGCITTTSVTINALPAPISGANGCAGVTADFTDAAAFGAWSSSNNSVATVGSSTGIVTGVALGTATISYTLSTGCFITLNDTINSVPSSITAAATVVCAGGSLTLSDATSGGSWSSSNTFIATVAVGTGIVTGVAGGSPVITYTSPLGCIAVKTLTINPLPFAIAGATSVYCIGSTTTLSDATSGGVWASSNTSVATVGAASGFVTGIAAGISTVTYTLPTGCFTTIPENISSSPAPISGSDVCKGATDNFTDATAFGAWSSSNLSVATVGSGSGVVTGVTSGTATITYELSGACLTTTTVVIDPLPSAITGTTSVCVGLTTALSDTGSGTWSSSVPVLASIGSASGIVTGLIASAVNITYTLPTGCMTTASLVVDPLPGITGTTTVCIGSTSALAGTITGGSWSSSNSLVATVGSGTGVVSGVALGTSVITYTLPTGCLITQKISVISLPAAISGATNVCQGLTTALTDVGGGGWYSSDLTVASVGFGTGIVTGVASGTAIITYSLGTSCNSYSAFTVNPVSAITGAASVCQSSATILSNSTSGGAWSSSNITIATIGSASGTVTGIGGGADTISYVTAAGCISAFTFTVNPIEVISGTPVVCTGLTTTLSDAITGGSWSSSNTALATIDPATGILSGVLAGTPIITYTMPAGCSAIVTATINQTPAIYTVTGGGSYCSLDTGVHVDLSGSVSGINYELYLGLTHLASFSGTGSLLDLGLRTVAGTYTVVATNPASGCNAPMAASATVGIITAVTPSLALAASTPDTICMGTPTTFSATPINGGATPLYQWSVNGVNVGADSASYGLYAANGDVVSIRMVSDAACIILDTVNQSITMTVDSNRTPSVSVSASTADTICAGTSVVFTAHPVSGGTAPAYTWLNKGVVVSTSATYGTIPADSATVITVIMNSNVACSLADSVADTVHMDVVPSYIPVVSITASPGTTIAKGQSVTFTASATDAGPAPSYSWRINSTTIIGATNSTYTNTVLANKDSISCVITGSGLCGMPSFSSVIMVVSTEGVQQINTTGMDVSLVPNPNTGSFTIKGSLSAPETAEVSLEVTDMLGQVVYSNKVTATDGNINEQVQMGNNLANGIYLLSLRSGNDHKVFRFVIGQ